MELKLKDLNEYRKMSDAQRRSERGQAIRAELEYRMRWMPRKWRLLVKCRYVRRMSVVKTCIEANISRTTFDRRRRELAEWLEDTDRYLEEMV